MGGSILPIALLDFRNPLPPPSAQLFNVCVPSWTMHMLGRSTDLPDIIRILYLHQSIRTEKHVTFKKVFKKIQLVLHLTITRNIFCLVRATKPQNHI